MLNYDNKKNEAIITTVYPVVNGNGANYIAMNLAYAAKKKDPHAKIAVVDFGFQPSLLGFQFVQDECYHGIDNLIDKINGGFLDEDLFTENMVMLKEDILSLERHQNGPIPKRCSPRTSSGNCRLPEKAVRLRLYRNQCGSDRRRYARRIVLSEQHPDSRPLQSSEQSNGANMSNNITAMAGPADIGILYNFYDGQNGISLNEEFDNGWYSERCRIRAKRQTTSIYMTVD